MAYRPEKNYKARSINKLQNGAIPSLDLSSSCDYSILGSRLSQRLCTIPLWSLISLCSPFFPFFSVHCLVTDVLPCNVHTFYISPVVQTVSLQVMRGRRSTSLRPNSFHQESNAMNWFQEFLNTLRKNLKYTFCREHATFSMIASLLWQ